MRRHAELVAREGGTCVMVEPQLVRLLGGRRRCGAHDRSRAARPPQRLRRVLAPSAARHGLPGLSDAVAAGRRRPHARARPAGQVRAGRRRSDRVRARLPDAARPTARDDRVMPAFSSGQWAGTVPATWARCRARRPAVHVGRRHPRASRRTGAPAWPASAQAWEAVRGRRAARRRRARRARAARRRSRSSARHAMSARRRRRAIGWYGDDFTGATDTLATLAAAGLRALLFLRRADAGAAARAAGPLDAIGIAGAARAMAPERCAPSSTPVGALLRRAAARACCTTRCCSTFDSAPAVGSIGAAVRTLRRGARRPAGADRRRPAESRPLLRVRQPVRGRRRGRRGASHRPPSDHEPASGDADGRGGPAAAPVAQGLGADRARSTSATTNAQDRRGRSAGDDARAARRRRGCRAAGPGRRCRSSRRSAA